MICTTDHTHSHDTHNRPHPLTRCATPTHTICTTAPATHTTDTSHSHNRHQPLTQQTPATHTTDPSHSHNRPQPLNMRCTTNPTHSHEMHTDPSHSHDMHNRPHPLTRYAQQTTPTHMTCTTAPQPLRASLSIALSRA